MKQWFSIPFTDVVPDPLVILRSQGVPYRADPGARIKSLLDEALVQLEELAEPVGLTREVTVDAFARIYQGEGHNEESSPLADIYPRAERLALFAVTLGAVVCQRITSLFDARDFALASMLDAAASEAADRAAEAVEKIAFAAAGAAAGNVAGDRGNGDDGSRSIALRYSPGYCGWHVSGQKALFANLGPEEIDITLRESFLMEPLKSVSGVIVAGPVSIHEFADDYYFCDACADHGCRARLRVATSRRMGRES